ncbi:sensor histidine kinase [Marinobacterium sediminicola]|uniref:histidine kinase n=1 Tax=Marinobacterium sediminicola TaxID=518898 RepID=A0ABY1RWG8_9GAMM|nr:ATP-binding protein [Marinobacterium sediminicola]ULG70405.1 ATP-binding protein [Marinobacterium sediminicola]SMR69454.1 PAS domain S-box-containing protein [Marinobacterium sediminicola]
MSPEMSSRKRYPISVIALLYIMLVCALAWFAGSLSRDWALARLQVQGADRLLASVSQMRLALDQYNYLPFLIAQNTDVHRLLQSEDTHQATVNRVLEQINLVAGSTALFVLDADGRPLAFSNWREEQAFPLQSQRTQQYFKQAIAGEQGLELQFHDGPEQARLYMSAPVYTDRLAGVAVMRLDMSQLREQLAIEYPLIVRSANDQLVFEADAPWPLSQAVPLTLGNGTVLQLVKHDGELSLLQSVKLDDLGWTVSVLTDIRPAQYRSRVVVGSLLGGGVALGLLLLYLRESRQKRRLQLERMRERARSEEQQRDIINTAQVGLIHIDQRGRVQLINPMAMQIFGVSVERVRNQPVLKLLGDGFSAMPLKQTLEAMGTDRFRPLTGLEVVGQRGDGSAFPMMISIRQMAHHPELGYLVTVIDISRRKRLEQALREANESLEQKVIARTQALEAAQAELVQAGKLAALGRMSASVVHELNQPMTAMRTYLAIAGRLLEQPEALGKNLKLQEQLLDRMALITGQLKTFAYRKPERIEPVSLQQVTAQVLQMFRGRFEELSLALHYDPPPGDLLIAGDNARYEQVLINLIKNACDAMAEQTGAHELWLQLVEVGEQSLLFEVRDNGPGIDAEIRSQLFEPFFTTKGVGQGLGLGLAIVSSILRDLGGDIHVEDRKVGACFRVSMPLYRAVEKESNEVKVS